MTKLLIDVNPLSYDPQRLMEQTSNNSDEVYILRNVLLQTANAKNQNGRIYPRPILEREVNLYMENFVQQRRALGECDHTESDTVNLKNVSHNIVNMRWDGDVLYGDLEILTTPSGKIIRELMKNRIKLGISSRGLGSVHKLSEGVVEVEDDYHLICWDIVSNPSTHGAFLSESASTALKRAKTERINSLVVDFLSCLKK